MAKTFLIIFKYNSVVSKGGCNSDKKTSIEAIPILYYLRKVSVKRLYRFRSQKFSVMKRYMCFYENNLSQQIDCIVSSQECLKVKWYKYFNSKILSLKSDCFVSNPRNCKDTAIQVLLRKKIWIDEAIVSPRTLEALSNEAIQYLLLLLLFKVIVWATCFCGGGGGEGIHRFHLVLKGQ